MKAKRMLAIVAVAFAILCGFAFASAKAQTNSNFVKPDATKTFVLGEGGTQKIYCDSGQVGAYSVSPSQNYNRIFSSPVYVDIFHSQNRKTWRWIDFVVVEIFYSKDNEQKFFFSRKIDGFYRFDISYPFDATSGREKGSKVSAVFKTFSWKSLVADINAATKVENLDGFSEEKMKLNDLGADYVDAAKKLSVLLRIAAESISTNPGRICYAKYLPWKSDETYADLVKYKNLFYIRTLAGSVTSFANSLQREPAFRAYAADLAKAADELKKTTDKWQLEQKRQKRQLPRQRLTTPPDKVFQEAAESMRKVAVCVETASEAMKSNLVLAEGGQVRRFSPLLAKELAVPVIAQIGPSCSKTANLMIIKFYYPDFNIDDAWLVPQNLRANDEESSRIDSLLKKMGWARLHLDELNWLSCFREQISRGNPISTGTADCRLLPRGKDKGEGRLDHAFVVTGFGPDGSIVFINWGERWFVSREEFFKILSCKMGYDKGFYGAVRNTTPIEPDELILLEQRDDTLALEKK